MNITQYIIMHLRKLGSVIISVMLNSRTRLALKENPSYDIYCNSHYYANDANFIA